MTNLVHILSIILPAGIVLFGMYLVVKSFTQKELEKRLVVYKGSIFKQSSSPFKGTLKVVGYFQFLFGSTPLNV